MRFKIRAQGINVEVVDQNGKTVLDYQLDSYKLDADAEGLVEAGRKLVQQIDRIFDTPPIAPAE